jgi:hypothetical protein
MSGNNDQQLVDYLYNSIFVQQVRCNHFNSVGYQSTNSIWNKQIDEKKILDKIIQNYKKYYKDKAVALLIHLGEINKNNVNSYLTYDPEYYIEKYKKRVEELNKYILEIDKKDFNIITTVKLSTISVEIDKLFPNYMFDPTLLGKL